MYRRPIVNLVLAALSSAACGGEAVGDEGSGGSGGAACPNIAGTWTVASHCDARFVGDPVSVAQSGCSFTDQTFRFSGTIDASGAFTATSTLTTEPATCTGSATATTIVQTCTVFGATCNVSLSR